jgi:hypothetical protein
MVRRELAKQPGVGNDALREKGLGVDRSVRRRSPHQLRATYRLPDTSSAT